MDKKTRKKLAARLAEDTVRSEDQSLEKLIQKEFDALINMSEKEFVEEWENFYGQKPNDPAS